MDKNKYHAAMDQVFQLRSCESLEEFNTKRTDVIIKILTDCLTFTQVRDLKRAFGESEYCLREALKLKRG